MACSRCEELEEEVAYYRSELGQSNEAGDLEIIRKAMRHVGSKAGRTGPSALVLALYRAHGRALTKWQTMQAVPPKAGGEDDREPKIVDVWVHQARRGFGNDVIETVWGSGHRLSVYGMDLIGRLLGEVPPIPEAVELQDRAPEELRSMAALIAGLLAHKDGDGGIQTANTYRRIADRLTGQPRVAA